MARAPLSIIIPTLNAQSYLPACLEALTPGLSTGLIREVLVCDGGSQDHTLVCAGQAGCRIVSGSSG
ncbi:MAG: glycosyltransferase, partial [Pseudomonadota bacterium]